MKLNNQRKINDFAGQASIFIQFALTLCVSKVMTVFPDFVSVWLGRLGFSRCVKRSKSVLFKSKCYSTPLRINVRGDYLVEREAASSRPYPNNPFYGIKKLCLASFDAIDVGANVGTFSVAMAAIGARKIYAVEPGPVIDRLRSNIRLNQLEGVVDEFRVGFSNQSGSLKWAEDVNNPGNAYLLNSVDGQNFQDESFRFLDDQYLEEVPVVTLDEFAESRGIEAVDLIKIDVEGMEWSVVDGARDVINRFRPIVVAETHRASSDFAGWDCLTPMFGFFAANGYKTFSLTARGEMEEFIYPNFREDTFFLPSEKIESLKGKSRAVRLARFLGN